MPVSSSDTTAERDYDAFFAQRLQTAKRDGLSDGWARFVARNETHDLMLADKGLRPYGAGDFEYQY